MSDTYIGLSPGWVIGFIALPAGILSTPKPDQRSISIWISRDHVQGGHPIFRRVLALSKLWIVM